jgi:hypothetical protein
MTAVKAPSTETDNGQSYTSESTAPSSEPTEQSVSSEPLSSQYAILARKEKALRQREQQLKAREEALKSAKPAEELPPQTPKSAEFDPSKYVDKERLAKDPFTVLNEMGLSYEQLTELALNAPKPEQLALMNEINTLKNELKALKGETENTKKTFEESQQQQYKQAVNQIKAEARSLITHDPQFETIKATDSIDDVVELIEQTFKQDGVLLTVEEAARQVEDYLTEEAVKLARLSKIQQKLAPKPSAPEQKPTASPEKQPLKTLTNSVSSSRTLSARERAILAMQGKLNK